MSSESQKSKPALKKVQNTSSSHRATVSIQEQQANNPDFKQMENQMESVVTPECLKNDYQILRLLGEGANGKTYLAVSTTMRRLVAIKELKLIDHFKSLELFKREAETLANVNIPGVPKFYGFVTSDKDLSECYIIQEFFDFPSLQDIIDKNNEYGKTFSEEETFIIICGITEILDALQTQYTPPIIHRDIKPSNILYDAKTQTVMLIDFGAVANPAKKSAGSTVAGTLGFMAPEQLMGECTIQSDYYAMAATALYMLTGVSPVDMENDPDNPFLLNSEPYLVENKVSDNMQKFLKDLMCPQIEERPRNSADLIEQLDKLSKLCYQGSLGKRNRITRKKNKDPFTVWDAIYIAISISLGCFAGFFAFVFLQNTVTFIIGFILATGASLATLFGKRNHEAKLYLAALKGYCHNFELISEEAAKALAKDGKYKKMRAQRIATCANEQYTECIYMRNGEYYYYFGKVAPGNKLLFREEIDGKVQEDIYEIVE